MFVFILQIFYRVNKQQPALIRHKHTDRLCKLLIMTRTAASSGLNDYYSSKLGCQSR